VIAVVVRADVALAGILIPAHRMLEVVEELPLDDGTERRVLTAGEARALVWSGLAEAVAADFDDVLASINGSKGG
jgi:hypothetical protein